MQFIQDNWMLASLAAVSGAMLIWSFIGSKISGIEEADTLKATRLFNDDALVLDVREDKEFAAGHIPKAKHIPLGQLSGRLKELDKFKGKPVLVTCRSGQRSARACGMLKKAGFETVYNQAGGIIAWERANLPVTK
ncbi:rhodanese-like domain-containing protein [Thiobacillus sp.]